MPSNSPAPSRPPDKACRKGRRDTNPLTRPGVLRNCPPAVGWRATLSQEACFIQSQDRTHPRQISEGDEVQDEYRDAEQDRGGHLRDRFFRFTKAAAARVTEAKLTAQM